MEYIAKVILITGLSKRVMTYRNRVKNAQRLPEMIKFDMVTLIGLDELMKLKSNIPWQGIS